MFKKEDILKREEEFLKLNAEIDLQTKSLLEEVASLKEFNVNSRNSYRDFTQTESQAIELEKENAEPITSSQTKNELTELYDRIKMNLTEKAEDFKSAENLGVTEEENPVGKNEKEKSKISLSAIVPSCPKLSTTNLEDQAVFPSERITSKSESAVKFDKYWTECIPEPVKEIGHEGAVRYLTAKIKVLGDQVQTMQRGEKKLKDNIKEMQIQRDKALEEKDRLTQQVNTSKNFLVKCEQNTQNLVTQLQASQAENNHLKKELESVKKEMRQVKQNSSTSEVKLNRSHEELDRMRAVIQRMKQEEKESKESNRRKLDDLMAAFKKADKQRLELLNGFKKQLIIIDNLKKQKILIDAAKLLKSTENDFINFLDGHPST